MINNVDDLVKKVEKEYAEGENGDLTSLFFDFDVDMTMGDILWAYGKIQKDINDDDVWLSPQVIDDMPKQYKGNCMKFLESLNDKPDCYMRYSEGTINSSFIF